MIPMDVLGLQIEEATGAPVLLLRERDGDHRVLPVFVGPAEAMAISLGLAGTQAPRPRTHDLLVETVTQLGAAVQRVDVVALEEGTFLAELELLGPGGVLRISSRPSDAVALAVRTDAPVYVAEAVLDDAGVIPEEAEPEVEEVVEDFRAFLDEIDPEDFAGS